MYQSAFLRSLVLTGLLCFGLLALLNGCSQDDTSIVGKWIDTRAGESTIEFKSDGTARLDADWNKMYATLAQLNPGKAEKVKAAVAEREADTRKLNAEGLTWAMMGDECVIDTPSRKGALKYRIAGETLLALDRNGKPYLEFRRVK